MRLRRGPLANWVAVLAASVGLVSCDPLYPDLVGLSKTEAGEVVLRFYSCPGESLRRISVLDSRDNFVGNADDDVYWEITSRSGIESKFVVGEAPAGFSEALPLTRALPQSVELVADIETTDISELLQGFYLEDLPQRGVDVDGEVLSQSEFRVRALERCR